ncbi:energy-coupling factor transporter transmembrane component T family protein [Aureibacillus halotolerans]|uniref:Energy-coupling factor transport system permease protein n=1 Tax=Aureibacillus halotolerans TaxID=1508390 RepID=A0A4R6TR72_9BACI|nr:energy-coupling factor transporter transmembrane component T [Aureibacillus halotolerans]TDQ34740.1 energy-coupling factor transport system permease protein [Aureibacillus halotolerans]
MIGAYVARDSPIHRMDPRGKIASVLMLSSLAFALDSLVSYALYAFLLVALYSVSRLPLRLVWANLRPVAWFASAAFLLHVLATREGDVLWAWQWIQISDAGLWQGSKIMLRLFFICAAGFLLPMTTSPSELIAALSFYLTPLKAIGLSPSDAALAMTIAMRYLPMLAEEAKRTSQAQLARGAGRDLSWRRPKKAIHHLQAFVIPLMIGTIRNAHALAEAIDSRGYDGTKPRTSFRPLRWTWTDSMKFTGLVLIAALTIFVRGD